MDINKLTYRELPYRELQKIAKEKGVKSFGVKKKELVEKLEVVRGKDLPSPGPVRLSETPKKEAHAVFPDGRTRRVFSLEVNGENYHEQAEKYAKNKGLEIKKR